MTMTMNLRLTLCLCFLLSALPNSGYSYDTTRLDHTRQMDVSLQTKDSAHAAFMDEIADLQLALRQEQQTNKRTVYCGLLIGMVLFFVTAQAAYARRMSQRRRDGGRRRRR